MEIEKIKKYYELSTDLWRFTKNRLETAQDTEDWWAETYRQANALLKKHEPHLDEEYIRKKINSEIGELTRICREGKRSD